MSSYFEWAVIAFIVVSILYWIWRGGSSNPVGTGKLQHDVSNVRAQVGALAGRVIHVEEAVAQLEREAATTKDIKELERLVDERIATMRAEMQGHHELSKSTSRNVQRIYDIMLDKGLGK